MLKSTYMNKCVIRPSVCYLLLYFCSIYVIVVMCRWSLITRKGGRAGREGQFWSTLGHMSLHSVVVCTCMGVRKPSLRPVPVWGNSTYTF